MYGVAKSDRSNPSVHAVRGDERIRTAVCALSTDPAYERRGEPKGVRVRLVTPRTLATDLLLRLVSQEHHT